MTVLRPVSLATPFTPPAREARFGRAPKPEELDALKNACEKAELDPARVTSLNTRVIENPDSTTSLWLYRVTQMPFDWIRSVYGYIKAWGHKDKPFDIHWAKFDKAENAQSWHKEWEADAIISNRDWEKDKENIRYEVKLGVPDATSVLKVLVHTPSEK